jgi:hypothetical protein
MAAGTAAGFALAQQERPAAVGAQAPSAPAPDAAAAALQHASYASQAGPGPMRYQHKA